MRSVTKKIVRIFKKGNDIVPQPARLPIALGLAAGFALVATVSSVLIYDLDGTYKLDLSRPGFEVQRAEVRSTTNQEVYDTTSPIDRAAIDTFLQEYDKRAEDLSQYGNFNDQALDDASLQIVTH